MSLLYPLMFLARPFTSVLCTDVKDVGYVIVSDNIDIRGSMINKYF